MQLSFEAGMNRAISPTLSTWLPWKERAKGMSCSTLMVKLGGGWPSVTSTSRCGGGEGGGGEGGGGEGGGEGGGGEGGGEGGGGEGGGGEGGGGDGGGGEGGGGEGGGEGGGGDGGNDGGSWTTVAVTCECSVKSESCGGLDQPPNGSDGGAGGGGGKTIVKRSHVQPAGSDASLLMSLLSSESEFGILMNL